MATEQFTGEEWRPVEGWPYEVSSVGRVRRRERARTRRAGVVLRGHPNRGYTAVCLHANGRHRVRPVHQLVAEAFLGVRGDGLQVNHIDGNRLNNSAANLEWVSQSENILHAYRIGLARALTGESHPNAVVSDADVLGMRLAFLAGESFVSIAARTGVGRSNAWLIVTGKARPHRQNSGWSSVAGAMSLSTAL